MCSENNNSSKYHFLGKIEYGITPYSNKEIAFICCWVEGRLKRYQLEDGTLERILSKKLLALTKEAEFIIECDADINEQGILCNIEYCTIYETYYAYKYCERKSPQAD